jgi:CheY-like chemotaxis protein
VIAPPAASRSAAPKPTVLLVDDHRDVLKSVSRVVAHDFDVVGLATDGREALDAVQQRDPDLVVLDITLPGFDGFQTARELVRRASRARVLFLSMHETEEFVTEGFRSGGRGYVLKRRVHQDLVRAIRNVLDGQLFAPTLKSLFQLTADDGSHNALFYDDDDAFVDGASRFLAMALKGGDVVSVITRKHIRAGIADNLQAQGWPRQRRSTRALPHLRCRGGVVVDHAWRKSGRQPACESRRRLRARPCG